MANELQQRLNRAIHLDIGLRGALRKAAPPEMKRCAVEQGVVYGYARVSAKDQNLDRQLDALAAFPVDDRCVFADKASGKNFDRPAYRKLLRRLRAGDVLVLKSIDRLGRNYNEILEQWRLITKEKQVYASPGLWDRLVVSPYKTEYTFHKN